MSSNHVPINAMYEIISYTAVISGKIMVGSMNGTIWITDFGDSRDKL